MASQKGTTNPLCLGADSLSSSNPFPDSWISSSIKWSPFFRREGLYRDEYEGETFRENLGLDVPENRNTAAKRARTAA